jgi:hypothetical protein
MRNFKTHSLEDRDRRDIRWADVQAVIAPQTKVQVFKQLRAIEQAIGWLICGCQASGYLDLSARRKAFLQCCLVCRAAKMAFGAVGAGVRVNAVILQKTQPGDISTCYSSKPSNDRMLVWISINFQCSWLFTDIRAFLGPHSSLG